MAEDGVKNPLLRGSLDVRPKTNQKGDPKRRRLRRFKSAPLANFSNEEVNGRDGSASLPPFKSTFGKVHPRKVVIHWYGFRWSNTDKGANYLVEQQELLFIDALYMSRKVGPVETLACIETNRVRNKCILVFIILLVLIVVGTGFLATAEKLDIVDAFYCVCSSVTLLGYGDKSFSTTDRVFAIFWILTSTLRLAPFFFTVAELKHRKQTERIS